MTAALAPPSSPAPPSSTTMAAPALASIDLARAPTAALRLRDPVRRRELECVLDRAADEVADVLVADLAPGETPPVGGRALLVLSDDPAHAADASLRGVLPRAAPVGQIAAAVAAIAAGLVVRVPPPPVPSVLTPREREILTQVGEGLSNKAIARRLGISAHTVKYHLEAVFTKLAARSRAEAVTQGLRRRLLG